MAELENIISNGVKGKYNKSEYPINVNAPTLFRWISGEYELRKRKNTAPLEIIEKELTPEQKSMNELQKKYYGNNK